MSEIVSALWPLTVLSIAALSYSAYLKTIQKKEIAEIEKIEAKLADIDERVRQISVVQSIGRM